MSRWGGDVGFWSANIRRMRDFAEARPAVVRDHIKSEFGLSGSHELRLEVNNEAYGDVKINTLTLTKYPWKGSYFQGVPVELEAIPKPGYSFLRWEMDLNETERNVTVDITSNP